LGKKLVELEVKMIKTSSNRPSLPLHGRLSWASEREREEERCHHGLLILVTAHNTVTINNQFLYNISMLYPLVGIVLQSHSCVGFFLYVKARY